MAKREINRTLKFKSAGLHDSHSCKCSNKFWDDDDFDIELDDEGNEIVQVEKADIKKPKKVTRGKFLSPEYQSLYNIARKIKPVIQAGIITGVESFRKRIDLNDIVEALDNGDYLGAMNAVPWQEFDRDLTKELNEVVYSGIAESTAKSKFIFRTAINSLIGVNPEIRFDASNERIRNYANKYTATLVENIREQTKDAIGSLTLNGINQGMQPRQIAPKIKQLVGLNSRQAQALRNREAQLVKQGFKGSRLNELITDYRDKQLTYRAETIARTEASFINNNGLAMIVEENVSSGYIDPRTAQKKWVVTPHDNLCDICAPMNGQTVGIYDEFNLGTGQSLLIPPAHPNCLCGWSLVFK